MTEVTLSGLPLDLEYSDPQLDIFFKNKVRYTVVPKGRRFGATFGAMHFIIDSMLNNAGLKILWVDTVHRNIDLYIERAAMPVLKQLRSEFWSWRMQAKELKILNSVCDFRSADKPQNIEGFGYHLIILNEAGIILNNRFLWQTSIRPMCLDYRARVWFLGTPKGRVCKKDGKEHEFLTLFKHGQDDAFPDWTSFQYSTYDGPAEAEDIRALEAETSAPLVRQDIYGEFIDVGSEEVFHAEWFKILNSEPPRKRALQVIQSWDTAFKKGKENDYSVCTTWYVTPTEYVCVDCWRDRVEYPELLKTCKSLYDRWQPDVVLIEDAASGQSLIQSMRAETRMPLRAVKADKDKYARACAVSNTIAAGKVHVTDRPWTKTLIDEMSLFPGGGNDDIVDTVVQVLDHVKHITLEKKPIVQRRVIRSSKVLAGY